jgi:hypothetical protein
MVEMEAEHLNMLQVEVEELQQWELTQQQIVEQVVPV